MRNTPLLLAALVTIPCTRLGAQTVSGHLLDAGTRQPVVAGTLSLLSNGDALASAITDSAGHFVLRAPHAGSFRLRAERIGYRTAETAPLDLADRDTLRVEFRISVDAIALNPITVIGYSGRPAGEYGGFYERLHARLGGQFITREQIDRQMPFNTTDLLLTLAGVSVTPNPRGSGNIVRVRGDCIPRVFLDGVPIGLGGGSIDDLVRPLDLEGIEVYRGPGELPVQFAQGACGAIVLWTRRGPE
jgi:hypothetical protein